MFRPIYKLKNIFFLIFLFLLHEQLSLASPDATSPDSLANPSPAPSAIDRKPITIFLETRPPSLPTQINFLYLSAPQNALLSTPKVGEIPAGQILRVDLSSEAYALRKQHELLDISDWRQFSVLKHPKIQNVFIKDSWRTFKIIRLSSNRPTLKYSNAGPAQLFLQTRPEYNENFRCPSEEVFCIESVPRDWLVQLLDTQFVNTPSGIKIYYQIQFAYTEHDETEQFITGWAPAEYFNHEINYYQAMQHSCIDVYNLKNRITPVKEILSELQVLPKRRTVIRKVSSRAFTFSKNLPENFRNRFIKTRLIQNAETNADLTVIREEIEITPIWGWSLSYGQMNLDHSTPIAHVTYKSSFTTGVVTVNIPAWPTVDIGLRTAFSFPTEQDYFDEIKNRSNPIDKVYQLYAGQLFIFHSIPLNKNSPQYHYGAGLSYRSMFGSSEIQFGFNSLIGLSLAGQIEWQRWILGGVFEPIGNNLKFGPSNYSAEINGAFKFTTRAYEPNWMLYTKIIDLRFKGEQQSKLHSLEYTAGVAYGL